jgi:hypothetical protein
MEVRGRGSMAPGVTGAWESCTWWSRCLGSAAGTAPTFRTLRSVGPSYTATADAPTSSASA